MSTRLTITVKCSDQAAAVDLEQKIRGLGWLISQAITSVEISSANNSPIAGYSIPREMSPEMRESLARYATAAALAEEDGAPA